MTHTQPRRDRRPAHLGVVSVVTATVVALLVVSAATAGSGSLAATLARWSKTVSSDVRAVALDARQRHPVRMTRDALRFRSDTLHAKAAIAALHPASARERSAQRLALSAFADFATAGSEWAASGRARSGRNRQAAIAHARAAAAKARAGNRLLISAGSPR